METNRFKSSQDFSNIQKNIENNPEYHTESYSQQVKDYISDMKIRNQEATKKGFMNDTRKTAREIWEEIEELASDAWDRHEHEDQ
ncbi:prevent-host-death protein [uncultured Chryseobacterium sp.]|uniref:prevent-host-death protein n=1 Tax=uncultured Chryseobacterium sp. TaxID=259322 RepID=UPI0025FBE544|nr:prevent-host-death protein [uncultured Chryseobacterium sp.]